MTLTEDVTDRVIEMQLDILTISMDAPSRQLFNFLRAGADFDTVCANIKRLTSRKQERDCQLPRVTIACTVSRHNMKYMENMVKLAHELGAQEITFADLIIVNPKNAHLSVREHPYFKKKL